MASSEVMVITFASVIVFVLSYAILHVRSMYGEAVNERRDAETMVRRSKVRSKKMSERVRRAYAAGYRTAMAEHVSSEE